MGVRGMTGFDLYRHRWEGDGSGDKGPEAALPRALLCWDLRMSLAIERVIDFIATTQAAGCVAAISPSAGLFVRRMRLLTSRLRRMHGFSTRRKKTAETSRMGGRSRMT